MSNPFASAFNYLSGQGGGSDGGNKMVGQTVDLGGTSKLKIKKVIAEGGYGYVFIAQDTNTGRDYALKRQVVSKENIKIVKREIAFLKQLGDHPHIINYVASAGIPPTETSHGNAEFLIQTELCSGGQMESVLRSCHLNPQQVLRVFYATCSAVAHMHAQQPPIIHRDLKVENLLLDSDGVIKLCDFGSATTQQLNPDPSWTSVQRGLAEDEIQRNTTPMYRTPEMIDLYSNKPISEKGDIWALGCLLYLLCFRAHPFDDGGKLKILNAKFKIPEENRTFSIFHGIIRSCLVVDPGQRPSVDAILAQLYSVSDQLGANMEAPSMDLLSLSREAEANQSAPSGEGEEERGGSGMSAALQSTSQQAQKLFGFMKDGAGSLFKNIKESSSKAISAMAASGPRRSSLDITYITSRILAMSYPHDDTLHGHPIVEVRNFLDERHPSAYLVFNLSGNGYDVAKLNNQVYDFPWPDRGVPELGKLVDLCRSMDAWLRADSKNVIVIHCHNGLSVTPVAIVAYMLFIRALSSPLAGLKYVALKRRPESPILSGTPSQLRYLDHMVRLVGQPPYRPHSHKLSINMLKLSTVPLFNAIRTGCKPFVEVYQEGERVYTSASSNTMESIRSFHSEDGSVAVPLGVVVRGNVTISVHHIRAIPVARKAGMGMTAVKMFLCHLHTGFLDPNSTTFKFDRKELDGSSVRKQDKFPSPFHATLEVDWEHSGEGVYRESTWQNLPYPKSSPLSCFSSVTEQEEVLKQLDPKKASILSRALPELPGTPNTPQSSTLHPLHPHQNPNFREEEGEEDTSAGSGNLLGSPVQSAPPTSMQNSTSGNAGMDFFSQLNWQEQQQQNAKSAGYVPYQDKILENFGSESSSGSDSDDSSSSDEFNEFQIGKSPIQFSASKASSHQQKQEDEGAGLLIGNFDNFSSGNGVQSNSSSSSTKPLSRSQQSPQIKLIEFGAEEQAPPASSISMATSTASSSSSDPFQTTTTSSASMDIFQNMSASASSTSNQPPSSSSGTGGVSFDPFGAFIAADSTTSSQSADSALDQLLGFGSSSGGGGGNSTSNASSTGLGSSASGMSGDPFFTSPASGMSGGTTGLAQKPTEQQPKSMEDIFDPFGSLSSNSANPGKTATSASNGGGVNLLGGPSLVPTPSASAPSSTPLASSSANNHPQPTNLLGEPFNSTATILTPSTLQSGPHTSRKLSTPDGFPAQKKPTVPMNNLSASFSSNVSFSHPNLSAFGGNQPGASSSRQQGSGWGYGMGSVSHNSSPRRSPSPVPPQSSSSTGNISQPQQQQQQTQFDPFGQFNLQQMSGVSANPSSASSSKPSSRPASANTPQHSKPPTGNSYQPYYMQSQRNGLSQQQSGGVGSAGKGQGMGGGGSGGMGSKVKSQPIFQGRSQSPNYNPSFFSAAANKTGVPTKPKEAAFGDLLGSNFSPKKANENKPLKDLKAKSDIENALDPDRAKVAAWAERKERNIRAIISSLHEILWEGQHRWKEVGMHQLVQPEQVSKFYRKACLCVHPDKVQDTEHEKLARAIFDELNDAYEKFEASGSRPLY